MVDLYRGLRCRPGDLAFIVQDEPECQANIGQLVRVLRPDTTFPDELGFHWLVQPQSSQPSPVLISSAQSKAVARSVVYDNEPRAHLDAWLEPLLEADGADEVTETVAMPAFVACEELMLST